MKKKQLKQLQDIAETLLQNELSTLAELQSKAAPSRQKLKELDAQKAALLSPQQDEAALFYAQRSGTNEKWLDWEKQRRRAIQADLAILAAKIEDQKAKAQKAFGKKTALAKLSQRLS